MIRDPESDADSVQSELPEVFTGLLKLLRNRLVRVSGILVLAATAWLYFQNNRPIYHTPTVDPILQQRLRQILDGLQDENQPHPFKPDKKKNPPSPRQEDVDLDETVIG